MEAWVKLVSSGDRTRIPCRSTTTRRKGCIAPSPTELARQSCECRPIIISNVYNRQSSPWHHAAIITLHTSHCNLHHSNHIAHAQRVRQFEMVPYTDHWPLFFCVGDRTVGYKMDTVYFGWIGNNPVEIPSELELPQFYLVSKDLQDCSTNYTTGEL